MARGVRAAGETAAQKLSRIRADRERLEREEREAVAQIKSDLAERLTRIMDGSTEGIGMFEQLVVTIERSGVSAAVSALAELPARESKPRGRGKDEGSGEKETGAAA